MLRIENDWYITMGNFVKQHQEELQSEKVILFYQTGLIDSDI